MSEENTGSKSVEPLLEAYLKQQSVELVNKLIERLPPEALATAVEQAIARMKTAAENAVYSVVHSNEARSRMERGLDECIKSLLAEPEFREKVKERLLQRLSARGEMKVTLGY